MDAPVPDPLAKGPKKLRSGKKRQQNLFTVPPGAPIWVPWRPFLAYDYSAEVKANGSASIRHEVSGGDCSTLVVEGKRTSAKREATPQERAEPNEILSAEDDCSAMLEAEAGLRLGTTMRLWDHKQFAAEPAAWAGVNVFERVACDGSLRTGDAPGFMIEPEEATVISSIPNAPLQVKEFKVDFSLSTPIELSLKICFELKTSISLGFTTIKIGAVTCLLKLKAEVSAQLLSFPLLTLPKPELQ